MQYTFISDIPAGHEDALDAYWRAVTFVAEWLSPWVAGTAVRADRTLELTLVPAELSV